MIEQFHIEVGAGTIADLRRRPEATRWPRGVTDSGGVPLDVMRDITHYWLEKLDWTAQERDLNASHIMTRDPSRRRAACVERSVHQAGITTLLVLTLAACERGRAPDGFGGPQTLAPTDVRILGSSESIGEVRDLEVLPDGSVWLLNSVDPFFIGFNTDGSIVGQHGTLGGGPEEFRMPAGLLTGGLNGEAWTFDFVRHAFIRISEPGAEWFQVAIRKGRSRLEPCAA